MKLKQFIKEHKTTIIAVLVLGLITYGIKLITYSFSIDTEFFLNDREGLLNSWLTVGRYGFVFFKRIIDFAYINLYLANFVSFILFLLSLIVLMYNVSIITNKETKTANLLLGSLIITSPIIVLLFNFTLQCVEVNLALLLLCLAFTIINRCIINKNKYYLLIISVIFTILSFASYQTMQPLFITFSAFFIMLFLYYKDEKSISLVLKYIAIFLISFILYKIIDIVILSITHISHSSYLDNQILWGTDGTTIKQNIINVIFNITNTLLSNDELHSFALLLCVAEFIYIIFNKFDKKKYMFYIAILTFLISPFALTILMGNMPTLRAQFQFPFVIGLSACFFYLYSNNDLEKKIYKIIFGIIVFSQIVVSVKLFYTDYETFKQQNIFVTQIENTLNAKNIENGKTLIFIGRFSSNGEHFYKAESLGATFFEWDANGPTGSNSRIHGFLKRLGYNYTCPTSTQYNEAKEISKNMPVYPQEDSIKEEKDYVIIKISN